MDASTASFRGSGTVSSGPSGCCRQTTESDATGGINARALAAKLISALYGLPLEHVLELDRSCADTSGGGLKIRFNGVQYYLQEGSAG